MMIQYTYAPERAKDLLCKVNILYTKESRGIEELLSSRRQVPKGQLSDTSFFSIADVKDISKGNNTLMTSEKKNCAPGGTTVWETYLRNRNSKP